MAGLKRGILQALVSGSHGRPQIAMEATAYWREPEGKRWLCEIVSILPTRVIQRPGSGLLVLDVLAGMSMQARGDDETYSAMVIESTAAPGLPDAARSRHKDIWANVRDVRIVTGGEPDAWAGSTTKVGAARLIGSINEDIEVRGSAYLTQVGGVPVAMDERLVAVSFARYQEGGDALGLSAVKSALATASDIRTSAKAGEEVLLATPAEAIAAAFALILWLAQNEPPPGDLKPGQRRSLSRAVGGIA